MQTLILKRDHQGLGLLHVGVYSRQTIQGIFALDDLVRVEFQTASADVLTITDVECRGAVIARTVERIFLRQCIE